MKTTRQVTDWVCTVCSREATSEGYQTKPPGWCALDYGPTADDEEHLCDQCWESLKRWPAFAGRADVMVQRKALRLRTVQS